MRLPEWPTAQGLVVQSASLKLSGYRRSKLGLTPPNQAYKTSQKARQLNLFRRMPFRTSLQLLGGFCTTKFGKFRIWSILNFSFLSIIHSGRRTSVAEHVPNAKSITVQTPHRVDNIGTNKCQILSELLNDSVCGVTSHCRSPLLVSGVEILLNMLP
jgi:hypothetical protein